MFVRSKHVPCPKFLRYTRPTLLRYNENVVTSMSHSHLLRGVPRRDLALPRLWTTYNSPLGNIVRVSNNAVSQFGAKSPSGLFPRLCLDSKPVHVLSRIFRLRTHPLVQALIFHLVSMGLTRRIAVQACKRAAWMLWDFLLRRRLSPVQIHSETAP